MKALILSWLLHHANRSSDRRNQFYPIKDRILMNYGIEAGYDIQHIPGKTCRSCGGTGQHARYSNYPPYKAYDWDDCWHCFGGWYKMPQWICLSRIKFGSYTFHRPLKRERCVKNPFTEIEMGWPVSDRPVIKGYIDHYETWLGEWALLILFCQYDRVAFREYLRQMVMRVKGVYQWKWWRLKNRFKHWKKGQPVQPGYSVYEDPELPF